MTQIQPDSAQRAPPALLVLRPELLEMLEQFDLDEPGIERLRKLRADVARRAAERRLGGGDGTGG